MAKVGRGKRRDTRKRKQHHDVNLLIHRARGLSDFPSEIILMVANQLPASFRTALALACQGFFALICPDHKFPAMGREDTVRLLLLIEKDHEKLYLCFGCLSLQPFKRENKTWRAQPHPVCDHVVRFIMSYIQRPFKIRPAGGCNGVASQFFWIEPVSTVIWKPAVRGLGGNEPAIPFAEARLVMDNYLFGRARGMSIDRFESSFQFSREIIPNDELFTTAHFPLEQHVSSMRYHLRPQHQKRLRLPSAQDSATWSFTHHTSARVIDDELFIRRHHDILGPPCTLKSFIMIIDSLELPVCRHILGCSYTQRMGSSASACIPELHSLRIIQWDSQWDIHPDRGISSCSICCTDYEISIERGSIQSHWGLKLTTYHRLGQCRTPYPYDPLWKNLVGFVSSTGCRYSNDTPGTVRLAWLKHNGQADNTTANLQVDWASGQQEMIMERFPCFSGRAVDGRKALWSIMNAGLPRHGEPRDKPGMVEYIGPKHAGEMLD